eukprot:8240571-Alexandrium_andersonii.AAC.1
MHVVFENDGHMASYQLGKRGHAVSDRLHVIRARAGDEGECRAGGTSWTRCCCRGGRCITGSNS